MFSSADNDILYQRQQASPDEFVSRPVRAIALCIPTVHHFRRKMHAHLRERKIFLFFFFSPRNACIPTVYHFTRKMHAHLRERKISCFFFLPGRRIMIATYTDLATYHSYLLFAIEREA